MISRELVSLVPQNHIWTLADGVSYDPQPRWSQKTFASLLLLTGFVGYKYGRKRTMNVGLSLFMIGSVLVALSGTSTVG